MHIEESGCQQNTLVFFPINFHANFKSRYQTESPVISLTGSERNCTTGTLLVVTMTIVKPCKLVIASVSIIIENLFHDLPDKLASHGEV